MASLLESNVTATGRDAPVFKITLDVIVSGYIFYIGAPAVIALGTVGNLLTLIVILSRHMGPFPLTPYLCALATFDTLSLYSVLFQLYLNYFIYFPANDINCKLSYFTLTVFRHIAVWLIVAITVDRFICVLFPLQARRITRQHRIIASVAVAAGLTAANLHYLIGVSAEEFQYMGWTYVACSSAYMGYSKFLVIYMWIADLFVYAFVPFSFIVICNFGMVVSMGKSRRQLSNIAEEQTKSGEEKEKLLTKLAYLLSFSFVIMVLPKSVYIVINKYNVLRRFTLFRSFDTSFTLLQNANHAVNFIFYCAMGPRFRNVLRLVFACRS